MNIQIIVGTNWSGGTFTDNQIIITDLTNKEFESIRTLLTNVLFLDIQVTDNNKQQLSLDEVIKQVSERNVKK